MPLLISVTSLAGSYYGFCSFSCYFPLFRASLLCSVVYSPYQGTQKKFLGPEKRLSQVRLRPIRNQQADMPKSRGSCSMILLNPVTWRSRYPQPDCGGHFKGQVLRVMRALQGPCSAVASLAKPILADALEGLLLLMMRTLHALVFQNS